MKLAGLRAILAIAAIGTCCSAAGVLGDSPQRGQSRPTRPPARPGWFLGRPYTVWHAALQRSRPLPYSD